MKLKLDARVSSDSPAPIGRVLVERFGTKSVQREGDDWIVRADVDGADARSANRDLLTELRRVEKKTRLRAEWTSGNIVERFFDYVPKSTGTANAAAKKTSRTRSR